MSRPPNADTPLDGLPHRERRARRPNTDRRLTRSRDGRVVAGVARGIAAYVDADPRVVRALWLVSLPLSGGITALGYLALWGLLPVAARPD